MQSAKKVLASGAQTLVFTELLQALPKLLLRVQLWDIDHKSRWQPIFLVTSDRFNQYYVLVTWQLIEITCIEDYLGDRYVALCI